MRRLSLPLLLAALLAASGCVTVHPTPTRPAGAWSAEVPADPKQPAELRPARSDTGPALPLSPCPSPRPPPRPTALPRQTVQPAPTNPSP
ncbi:hypothetical protein AB4039_25350 [Streptomyces sp. M-16]|uniref:hypothetical protein n=1 Tax=Streptomyces sp. M-16 TaxID=3233040 RepID=UPI002250F17D